VDVGENNPIWTLLPTSTRIGGTDYQMSDHPPIPLRRVRVKGPSMVPTLRDGDTVIVRYGARVRPGDVVLARFRSMSELLVLKRAVRQMDGGWWLASDNKFAGGDSFTHGIADVQGKVMVRFVRWLPRRVR
jgi:phage repressor protein C with HTH and peptisase S24 domain